MKQIKSIIIIIFFFSVSVLGFAQDNKDKVTVYLFSGKGCPHCEKEKEFLKKLQNKYPYLEVKEFEVWENEENRKLLEKLSKELNINASFLPITIIGKKHFIGFLDEKTSGRDIEKAIIFAYQNGYEDILIDAKPSKIPETIEVTFLGEIKIKNLSLPLLTIVLAAIDGFNPCAMWVLLMLISFLMAIQDRKKMVFLGSIFYF